MILGRFHLYLSDELFKKNIMNKNTKSRLYVGRISPEKGLFELLNKLSKTIFSKKILFTLCGEYKYSNTNTKKIIYINVSNKNKNLK